MTSGIEEITFFALPLAVIADLNLIVTIFPFAFALPTFFTALTRPRRFKSFGLRLSWSTRLNFAIIVYIF